jgi:FkbM family methyltransferase
MNRFLEKPFHEQSRSIYARWRKFFPTIPFPVWLPFGAWFMGRNDYLGSTLTFDGFEPFERAFVQRFLQPGMTVLDIGAHHGYYTLLASKLVGSSGKVFAFEPSPRESKALRLNLTLNRSKNVSPQPLALGKDETQADLFVVSKQQTGFNSLRPPSIPNPTIPLTVHVVRLDDWLRDARIDRVDFIKLDVEGGELAVLQGGADFLGRRPRPVILAELDDARSKAWGHTAQDVAAHLSNLGFQWFTILESGILQKKPLSVNQYDGNLVAVPEERLEQLSEITTNGSRS